MAKRGRKRKPGIRTPSGQLSRATAVDAAQSLYGPADIARMRSLARHEAQHGLWGSSLGRLNLTGVISDQQLSAGLEYAILDDRCRRAMGLPRETVAAQRLGALAGPGPDGDPDAARALDDRRTTAQTLAVRAAGPAGLSILHAVCLQDLDCDYGRHEKLRAVLTAFAQHFGFGAKKLQPPGRAA